MISRFIYRHFEGQLTMPCQLMPKTLAETLQKIRQNERQKCHIIRSERAKKFKGRRRKNDHKVWKEDPSNETNFIVSPCYCSAFGIIQDPGEVPGREEKSPDESVIQWSKVTYTKKFQGSLQHIVRKQTSVLVSLNIHSWNLTAFKTDRGGVFWDVINCVKQKSAPWSGEDYKSNRWKIIRRDFL